MEIAPKNELYHNPLCPYTQALLSAIPSPDPHLSRKRIFLKGDVPSPIDSPAGCRFASRCLATPGACEVGGPNLTAVLPSHRCACHRHANVKQSDVAKLARQIECVTARPAHGMTWAEPTLTPIRSRATLTPRRRLRLREKCFPRPNSFFVQYAS
ncbi:oligopeptide/dipeptide ABC transporter ATP-binding protein [Parafannyhessea umbonata]|uniref:oligopeptide/dipeptide ABC transporter ATP-binding protein n=1 Tax=Parafannyhessea umbonata TaxID=604330 RepID=UPI0026F01106|nr:oligopeptide/dipeptide ABC transporter ATP-binding protein [Parafannyhessea umbonata]